MPRIPKDEDDIKTSKYSHTSKEMSKTALDTRYEKGPKVPQIFREKESDELRLKNRQKQIDYGKNTIGYANYIKQVPKDRRRKDDPQTPDKLQKCSKRSWDGQIKLWRRKLHSYDPAADNDEIVINPEDEDEIIDIGEEEIVINPSLDPLAENAEEIEIIK